MKYIQTVVLGLILTVATLAQENIVPIYEARVGGLLGGVKNGKYVAAEEASKFLKAGDKLSPFTLAGAGSRKLSVVKINNDQDVCTEFYYIQTDRNAWSGIGFGEGLSWNPLPRIPQKLSLSNAANIKVVSAFLVKQKIRKPKVKITQAFSIDIDGDGQQEQFLAATRYTVGFMVDVKAGDYSFVLMRKMVGGKMRSILIDGEFYPKSSDTAPNKYEISAIADLNGDSKMEIVVHAAYYEGSGTQAFELDKEGVREIPAMSVGCGV